MAGLLGSDELNQGLLGLGAGLLSNSSGHYGQFAPALGAGMQGFNQNWFGAAQQRKDNDERTKRLKLLEQMQSSQIAENDSQARARQYKMDEEARQQALRARILGGYGQQQPAPMGAPQMPQGLGGQMGGTVLPPAAAAAEGDLLASQVRQPAQNAPMQAPTVEVPGQNVPFLQNKDALRDISAKLQAAGLHQDAMFYSGLADKLESQSNVEANKQGETYTDNQGIVRYKTGKNVGEPLPNQQPKLPEGFEMGEDGRPKPIPEYWEQKKGIAKAGATNVAVNSKEQTEEAKTVGKFYGEQYGDIQKSGFNSQAKIDRFNRLEQLLDGVSTGKLTPVGTDIAAYAKSIGMNIDDKLPNKEAAAALINAMALELRNPSGGAGMPGAMSDADREYLRSMVPSLANTPEGRKQLIETGRKMAQREKDVARLARDYRKKHGGFDDGFQDVLEEFSAKNPLFSSSGGLSAAEESRLQELERKRGAK